jgi:hypothetical protein
LLNKNKVSSYFFVCCGKCMSLFVFLGFFLRRPQIPNGDMRCDVLSCFRSSLCAWRLQAPLVYGLQINEGLWLLVVGFCFGNLAATRTERHGVCEGARAWWLVHVHGRALDVRAAGPSASALSKGSRRDWTSHHALECGRIRHKAQAGGISIRFAVRLL